MSDNEITKKAVAYYRVSTRRQGESGLGLEAQKHSVSRYASSNGFEISAEYTEIETGTKKRKRVEIYRAIAKAKELGATLLIAKIDRLARNVAFISALQDSGVDFIAVDMPNANKLTVHILAAIAEDEADRISQRTKDALRAAKARGVKLGTPANFSDKGRIAGARRNREDAIREYRTKLGYIRLLREKGLSYGAIAERLNQEGHTTRRGKAFVAATVYRMVARASAEAGSV